MLDDVRPTFTMTGVLVNDQKEETEKLGFRKKAKHNMTLILISSKTLTQTSFNSIVN